MKHLPPPTFPYPITWCNNTVTMIFLAQMRQCNGCESIRNNIIFNSQLGSGAGPWVSILCLLQDTTHIHWLHAHKHSSKKKQNILKKDQTPNKLYYCLGLGTQNPRLREVDLEPSNKRGCDKIKKLRPWMKNKTKIKLHWTDLTHKQEPST